MSATYNTRASIGQMSGGGYALPIKTQRDDMAAQALADAIQTSRQGIGSDVTGMYAGRLDNHRLARLATGQLNVFKRPLGARPNRVRLTILVDASSSMTGFSRRNEVMGGPDFNSPRLAPMAAQVVRDLVEATEMLDWVTANVVAFSNGSSDYHGSACLLYPIWETGQPTDEVDSYGNVPMSGTEEGYALAWAHDDLLEACQNGEQALVIIVSDGAPSERLHVQSIVQDMAADDIPVVSVALVPSASQPLMYGDENVIDFNGSSIALGYDMAAVIGRVL